MPIIYKQGDTVPRLEVILLDGGDPASLAGATVDLVMRPFRSTADPEFFSMTPSAEPGGVFYEWASSDLSPGRYLLEYQVEFADQSKRSYPSHGYDTLKVIDLLAIGSP